MEVNVQLHVPAALPPSFLPLVRLGPVRRWNAFVSRRRTAVWSDLGRAASSYRHLYTPHWTRHIETNLT